MRPWRELTQDEKIELLNRDLSTLWFAVCLSAGIGLGLLISQLL